MIKIFYKKKKIALIKFYNVKKILKFKQVLFKINNNFMNKSQKIFKNKILVI